MFRRFVRRRAATSEHTANSANLAPVAGGPVAPRHRRVLDDGRGIPVNERERKMFLRSIEAGLSVTAAARAAGRNRKSFQRIRNRDAAFADAWARAEGKPTRKDIEVDAAIAEALAELEVLERDEAAEPSPQTSSTGAYPDEATPRHVEVPGVPSQVSGVWTREEKLALLAPRERVVSGLTCGSCGWRMDGPEALAAHMVSVHGVIPREYPVLGD